jgi:long-chain acyl-CoA synthetase
MMQGYYKKEEDTRAVLSGGVLRTGDLGYLDAEGRVHITGRKKDMLVLPGGTKLFLPEYEAQLAAALGTAELAVFLEKNGSPALLLQAAAEEETAIREKLRPLMAQLPRGEQIGKIYFTDKPMPRTATGKIRRWEIQKEETT